MRLSAIALGVTCILGLSSCGNEYMLYETRYIPEPGERISHEEYAELPWKEPYLKGQSAPHTPTRDAIPRFQTPGKMGVNRGTRNFRHSADSHTGYLDDDHAENRGVAPPKEAPPLKPF